MKNLINIKGQTFRGLYYTPTVLLSGENMIYANSDKYGYKVDICKSSESLLIKSKIDREILFDDFIKLCYDIKKIADEYVKNNTSLKSELIISQYGRSVRYTGTTWSIACGTVPSAFVNMLGDKFKDFPNIERIILPNGETLDAPHFWAVINGILKGNGDLCGWGGDLVTFQEDLNSNSSLVFPAATFDAEDWRTDADAYNIMKLYSSDIFDGFKKYFTKDLNEEYRVQNFIIPGKTIYDRYTGSSNKMLLSILERTHSVTSVEVAAQKMQDYIDSIIS